MRNLEQQLIDFPNQFEWEPDVKNKQNMPDKWENILICGMGGSALPGLLLQSLLKDKKVNVHRDYGLPQYISKNTLVVVISYSGNTEEAISAYNEAIKQKLSLAAIASGGELEKLAQKNKTFFIKIPGGIQPRIALGYQFKALLELTSETPKDIKVDSKEIAEEAKKLVAKVKDSISVIYASDQNKALAYIFKIQLNETGKQLAFWNVLPELNHNELESWNMKHETWNMEQFTIILLKDKSDTGQIQRRMDLTGEIIKKNGYSVDVIDISNDNWYNKVIYSVLLGGWLSYYLATNKGIDPESVPTIEGFKQKL